MLDHEVPLLWTLFRPHMPAPDPPNPDRTPVRRATLTLAWASPSVKYREVSISTYECMVR